MGTSDFWSQMNSYNQFKPDMFKKDENLDLDELSEKLNINKLMLHSLFLQADTDGDGKINQNNSEQHNELQSLLNSLNAKFTTSVGKKADESNVYEYTDSDGNQVTEEYDNLGNLLKKAVQLKASDNPAEVNKEITTSYNQGKIVKKEVKRDGKTIEKYTYTYDSSDDKTGFVSIKSEKEDGSEETINTIYADKEGNTYGFAILSYYKKDSNGEKTVVKTEQGVQETVIGKDGNGKVKLYRSFDAVNYSNGALLAERYIKDNKAYDVQYDGKGNSVVFARNNDSIEAIAKRFKMTVSELHELNPKLKNLKIGDAVVVKGIYTSDSKEVQAQGDRNIEMKKYNRYVAEPEYIYTHNYSKIDRNIYDQLNKTFKVGQDNHIFYLRFSELKPEQQRNALNVVKYCVSKKITNPEQIKAEILKIFPEINLFDSGLSISAKRQGADVPAFQRTAEVMSLEQFIKDVLKLDIKQGLGEELYKRLSAQGQEALNKISADDFRNITPAFGNIADKLASLGVNIRNIHEKRVNELSAAERKDKLNTEKRFAAQLLSNIYRQAAQMLHNHLHNKGIASLAVEDARIIADTFAQHFTDFFECEPRLIAEYEKLADKFDKIADSTAFAHEFEKVAGVPFNEKAVQKLMKVFEETNGDMNSEKFKRACNEAFGFRGLENTENKISLEDNAGFLGDAILMVYTMGVYAESKTGQYFTQGLKRGLQELLTSQVGYGKAGQYVAQKGAVIGANMLVSMGTMGGFTGVSRVLLNSSDLLGADWDSAWTEMKGSIGFGAFAGVWGEVAVAPFMKMVQRAVPKTQKAVTQLLKANKNMNGKQVMDLFIKNQNPGALVKLSGLLPEAFGFGGYEAALMAIENEPDPETGKKLSDMSYDEAMDYVKRSFGNQIKQLGVFKAAGWFLMLRKGGSMLQKAALQHMMEETKVLSDVNIKTERFNGEEFYVVESHGQKFATKNINDVIEFCQVSLAHGTFAPIIMTKGEEGYREALNFDAAKQIREHFETSDDVYKLDENRFISKSKDGKYHLWTELDGKRYQRTADDVVEFFQKTEVKNEGVNQGANQVEKEMVKSEQQPTKEGIKSVHELFDGKYDRPLTSYDKIGNKIFEVKQDDLSENPEKINEIKAEIETLKKTEPTKAEELEMILEVFTNPVIGKNASDKQIDAVVNYLNEHYGILEDYLTLQAGEIGLSDEKIGRFGHRMKGEWSTRDKIVNYIKDDIEKEQKAIENGNTYKPATLLDAMKDVRDKYASRTVFEKSDYSKHPEIVKILEEGNYSDEAYRKAHLRAAELQSQPVVEMLKEAMRKAVQEGKDLRAIRISNYASKDGISVLSERQLADLKREGAKLGIDVNFIRLAEEIDPALSENERKAEEKKLTTKAQPSGYTALQINFVTKTGEVIEWQYRGELVNIFAEAEHLPYDLRTGKHPWNQYPELKALYKPIADLLNERNMSEGEYNMLNKYFTDYYTHLRKLELGFESREPKLEDYEKYTDENGVVHTFKFDKRLSAENLGKLHEYGEAIKDGVITPERALAEYNAEVGHTETGTLLKEAKILSQEEILNTLKDLGFSDNDIMRIYTKQEFLSCAIETFSTLKEYNQEAFKKFPVNEIINIFNNFDEILQGHPLVKYFTRDNVKAVSEVAVFEDSSELMDLEFWGDNNFPELYRVAKHYFEVTGEKFPVEYITHSNHVFKEFPSNEQIDIALKMCNEELWEKRNMLVRSLTVESPEKINDGFIAVLKELKAKADAQDASLNIQYDLSDAYIEVANKLKEYADKSQIDFPKIYDITGYATLDPIKVLFYCEAKDRFPDIPEDMLKLMIKDVSGASDSFAAKELATFLLENPDIYKKDEEFCRAAVYNTDMYNVELAKKLLTDKDFPVEYVADVLQSISYPQNYSRKDTKLPEYIRKKAAFAEKLCFDKTLNYPAEITGKLIEHYIDGCEDTIINAINSGLLSKHPALSHYPADCWDNIMKRGYLKNRTLKNLTNNYGYDPTSEYARAHDDEIMEKHMQLRYDALANKDLLKTGMDDLTDYQVFAVTDKPDAVKTIDLIGLVNTEAAFPLMFDEFNAFIEETSELAQTKLSEENKELLRRKINPAQSQRAKQLNEEITALKRQINRAVGKDNLAKIKKFQAQKAEAEKSVSDLKEQLEEARMASPEYKTLAQKAAGLNQKSSEYKECEKRMLEIENGSSKIVNLKNSIKELQKQAKTLGSQAQAIYYSCENANDIKELMKQVSSKQKELKSFIAESSGLDPQDVVTKVRAIYALIAIVPQQELADFINMIKPSSPENDAAWNEAINKKIYQKMDVQYDEVLAQKLDLVHCRYLSKMLISSEAFFANMRILVNVIKAHPELSVVEAIDNLPQNIETKRIFTELGFDFEKFTKIDNNSFTKVKVKLSADEAKQAAIHNLEEDLNDPLFLALPKNITEPIFTKLKEELGVTLEKTQKDNWEGDGFSAGTTDYYRLYKDGKPIVFEDMEKIVKLIKSEINKNNFWTRTQSNEDLDNARKTIYTHLIKMRTQEVDNALNIVDGETAEIEIRKTDMYDIKKALGLGNDAQCCTGLGKHHNEWSAPNYIMNKCIGAIELTDKGSFVGNTMIYLAYVDGNPALVLDNIELKTKYQNNDKIRDAFMDYAKKLCAEIGQPDLPIFAGPNRHKLNMDNVYLKEKHTMEIIGNSGNDAVYVDYDTEAHVIGQGEVAELEMYQIR